MKIALCDDDNRIMDILEDKLKKYSEEHNIEFNIKRFLGGEELLKYDLNEIDLLFLDMEMPGLNGVEVATEIRKTNRSMAIIFVTAFEKFVFESFKVNAFRYLLKPLDDNKFTEALDALISQSNNDDNYLCFSFQNENYRIAYNNIIYIAVMFSDCETPKIQFCAVHCLFQIVSSHVSTLSRLVSTLVGVFLKAG